MAKNNHSIGNAGEFYVLAQLAQRGYIAGKTDDGQTLIDGIATDPETLKSINIQVKTRDGAGDAWLMSAKNERAHEGLVRAPATQRDRRNARLLRLHSSSSVHGCITTTIRGSPNRRGTENPKRTPT